MNCRVGFSSGAQCGSKVRRWMARRLYKRRRRRVLLSACYVLVVRATVMAARVRLKMQCGTAALPFVVLVIVCSVDLVCGMFEHRHCSHKHPREHEVRKPSLLARPLFCFFPFFSLRRAASSNLSLLPFSLSLSSRRFCSGLNTQVAPKRHVSRPFAQHPIRIRHCLTVCKHADLSAVAAFLFGSCFFILVLFFRYPMSTHNSTPRSINFVATFRLFISTFNLL